MHARERSATGHGVQDGASRLDGMPLEEADGGGGGEKLTDRPDWPVVAKRCEVVPHAHWTENPEVLAIIGLSRSLIGASEEKSLHKNGTA